MGKEYCSKWDFPIPRLASNGSLIKAIAGGVLIENVYYVSHFMYLYYIYIN